MLRNKLFHLLSLSTLIVFVLSAVLTVPALADGGSTPPPTAPSSGGRTSNKGSPLSQVPSGTKVVVVDASGNKLPLGSQAAQDIVNNGDPIWCPSTVSSPVAGMSGCSPLIYDTSGLAFLTNAVESGTWHPTATNSTIWILGGGDSSDSPSYLDGGTLTTLSNFTLTLAGGWTGSGHTVNTLNPTVIDGGGVNNVDIVIVDWHNTVTLSNIKVQNGTGDGFHIGSAKNIVLTNIQAIHNNYYGAELNPGTGVTVTNSTFNQNDAGLNSSYGLYIYGNGPVTLTDTTANNNLYYGAYIDTADYGTAPVTLTGTNIFDGNSAGYSGDGLYVLAHGTITSGSLDANQNGLGGTGNGVSLDNCYWNGSSCGFTTSYAVTLTGTSSFSQNGNDGLLVHSNGAISVNNVTADCNGTSSIYAPCADAGAGYGAFLENDSNPAIHNAVKVTGTNWFNNNYFGGLSINSYGAISLNNLNIAYNALGPGFNGLFADNEGVTGTPQGITLTGTNTLNYNGYHGGGLYSYGAITVNNVTADCNGYSSGNCSTGGITGRGLNIANFGLGPSKPQAVTFLGTNELSFNDGDNLDIDTYGAVKLNNITANSSKTGYGANLDPTSHEAGAVTLTGTNTFNGNSVDGLYIVSTGAITASNLTASVNGSSSTDYGAYLTSFGNVRLTGASTFNFNKGTGLYVVTSGTVTASNLTADTNGIASSDYGAELVSTGKQSLTGTNTFDFDYGKGLEMITSSTLSASNLNAIGNVSTSHNDGVDLIASGSVSLTGTNVFDYYYGDGLFITTSGSITASSLTADFNGYGGSDVYGANLTSSGNVTLTGNNVFNGNHSYGLVIVTSGTVKTNNVTADDSATSGGANIDNQNGPHVHNAITMTGVNTFNNNAGGAAGLYLRSDGAITTSNVTANNNQGGSYGALFDNCDNSSVCHGTGNISMTGTNVFLYNATGFDDGIDLYTNGNVSVTHITADYNDNDGMYVQNTGGTVTVTCGSFVDNGWDSGFGFGLLESPTWGTPSHTYLTGVDSAGNTYNIPGGLYNVTTSARTCTLP